MPISTKHFLNRARSIALSQFEKALFWIVNLQAIQEAEVIEAIEFLDTATLQRATRLIFVEDQQRFILTHAILRSLLAPYLQQEPQEVHLLSNAHGKPYVQDHPLHFNLSHTKQFAFIGLHFQRPIGVDIEMIRNHENLLKSAQLVMHPSEVHQLLRNPCERFYTFWCAKEALLKAKGTGFATDLLPQLQGSSYLSSDTEKLISKDHEIFVYNEKIPEHKLAVCIA